VTPPAPRYRTLCRRRAWGGADDRGRQRSVTSSRRASIWRTLEAVCGRDAIRSRLRLSCLGRGAATINPSRWSSGKALHWLHGQWTKLIRYVEIAA